MIKADPNLDVSEFVANKDKILSMLKHIEENGNLAQLSGMSQEQLDQLYGLAYSLYQAENFDDAKSLFALLGLLDVTDSKYILGSAGCLFAQKKYEQAFDSYQMAFIIDNLNNPEPLYQSAICLIKLGRKEDAYNVLDVADACGREDNERHQMFKSKCLELKQMLEQGLKNKVALKK